VLVFEAPWDKDGAGPAYMGEFRQSSATRRIALCWDDRQFEPMPGLNSLFDAFEDGGVFVLPIYWRPEYKKWTAALGGMFFWPIRNDRLLRRYCRCRIHHCINFVMRRSGQISQCMPSASSVRLPSRFHRAR
jgi:hypothetical protein